MSGDEKPFVVKQIDSLCKVAVILDSSNGKIDKKMLSKCEDDIENAVMNDDFDGFEERYTNVFGKDTMDKANAIQSIILDLVQNVPDGETASQ